MNRFYKLTALLTWVLAFTITGNAVADGEWLRTGPVWLKGLIYAGTSRVAITNAAGNLSTTSLALTGNATVAGNETVTGTLAVTGAVTLRSTVAVTDALSLSDELILLDAVTGATAGTGGQATGTAITQTLARFNTVATDNDSVLPAAAAGLCVIVGNGHATVALDVFPASGDVINKESADAAVALAAGETMFCCAVDTTNWMCVIGSAN